MRIQLRQVEYVVQGKPLMQEVTHAFITGITYVVGKNGVGKSTLLKLVATAFPPSSGEIRYTRLEKDQEQGTYRRPLVVREVRSLLGYLPQDFTGYPEMTVKRYLKYAAYHKGVPRQYLKAHLPKYLEESGLTPLLHKRLDTLSGGQVKKVGLLQALLHQPKICILDEPFEGLDVLETMFFKRWLHKLSYHSVILISTNQIEDIDEAREDEVLYIEDGMLRKVFSSRDVKMIEGAIELELRAKDPFPTSL